MLGADYCTGFWLHRTKHHPGNARMHNGAGTHGAGFNGDVERGTRQAIILFTGTGIPQRGNFGVGRGIATCDGMIETLPQHNTVAHNHRTHRDFVHRSSLLRQCKRVTHPVRIISGKCGFRYGHGWFPTVAVKRAQTSLASASTDSGAEPSALLLSVT